MTINNDKLASVLAFDFGVPYTSDIDGEKGNFEKKMNNIMQNKIALLLLVILLSQKMDAVDSHRNSGKI